MINNKYKLYLYDENIFFKLILSQDIDWLLHENALKFIDLDEEDKMIAESNKWLENRNKKIFNEEQKIKKKKNGWGKNDYRDKQLIFEKDIE